jgi:hypothetical protein
VNEFWSLTPREVQLSIRSAGDIRLDRYDELIGSAWHNALWSKKKMPKLEKVLAKRPGLKQRGRTFEEEIRRWEIFFAASNARFEKGKAN